MRVDLLLALIFVLVTSLSLAATASTHQPGERGEEQSDAR